MFDFITLENAQKVLSYSHDNFLSIIAFLFISFLVIKIFLVPFLKLVWSLFSRLGKILFGSGDGGERPFRSYYKKYRF